MPIYEYECEECGSTLDTLQKFDDPPLTDCPGCGSSGLKRLVSAPRFRLSGSGWYETDFKNEDQRNLTERPEDKSSAAKKEETKTPDKPKADKGKSGGSPKKSGEAA